MSKKKEEKKIEEAQNDEIIETSEVIETPQTEDPILDGDVIESKDLDIAGKEPVAIPVPARIETQEQAEELVKSQYKVPAGCLVVYVTSDKNVFWQEHGGSAQNHAEKNNLKLFRVDGTK